MVCYKEIDLNLMTRFFLGDYIREKLKNNENLKLIFSERIAKENIFRNSKIFYASIKTLGETLNFFASSFTCLNVKVRFPLSISETTP